MKKVLWISRHQMTKEQRADLEHIVGESVEMMQWSDTVKQIQQLQPAVETADFIAAVLPMELMAELLKLAGEKPVLQASSQRVATGRNIELSDGRTEPEFAFVHQGWKQVLSIEIVTKQLSDEVPNTMEDGTIRV